MDFLKKKMDFLKRKVEKMAFYKKGCPAVPWLEKSHGTATGQEFQNDFIYLSLLSRCPVTFP
jgi:hypothetical protein